MMSIGACTLAISLHLRGLEPGARDDLDLVEAGLVQLLAQMEDRRRGDAGADQPAQLGLVR